jgi:hypothetical protein
VSEHPLQRDCLNCLPLTQGVVEWWFDGRDVKTSERMQIARLCRSHERLRAELAGAEAVIARREATIKQQQREIMELKTELERERVSDG